MNYDELIKRAEEARKIDHKIGYYEEAINNLHKKAWAISDIAITIRYKNGEAPPVSLRMDDLGSVHISPVGTLTSWMGRVLLAYKKRLKELVKTDQLKEYEAGYKHRPLALNKEINKPIQGMEFYAPNVHLRQTLLDALYEFGYKWPSGRRGAMDTHDYITVNTFKEKEILHSDSPSPYATLKYSLPRDWGPAMDALKKEHIAPDLSRNVGGVWFYFSVDDRVLHAGCIRLSPSTVGYLYNAREVVRCNSEVISITIQPHGTNSTIKLANDGRIIADGIRLISPEVDDVFDWYFELTDQLLEEERNATT